MAATAPTRPSSSNLTRSERATIRSNWSELARYLAAPRIQWSWGESGLSERLKHYLKSHNLIVRDPDDDEKWQTTEDLWIYVISRAGDEEIGTDAEGQCKIQDRSLRDPDTRILTTYRTPHRSVQETLSGDSVDPVNDRSIEQWETNQSKDPTKPSSREKAAHHADQSSLAVWCAALEDNPEIDEDVGLWDVTTVRSEAAVRAPAN